MVFDRFNAYAHVNATEEKKLGCDSYIELALATGRARCGCTAERAGQACVRGKFAALPGGVEDSVQATREVCILPRNGEESTRPGEGAAGQKSLSMA
jgi:hypothetical protein